MGKSGGQQEKPSPCFTNFQEGASYKNNLKLILDALASQALGLSLTY